MHQSNPTDATRHSESGSILVETAIFLPFLILVLAGLVQIGTALWDAQVITRAAYEGARLAAKTPGMELKLGQSVGMSCASVQSVTYNSFGNPTQITSVPAGACAGHENVFPETVYSHQAVHDRINFAMSLESLRVGGSPLWSSTLTYDASLNRIIITVTARMRLLKGVGGITIPINVQESLPYLSN